MERGIVGSGARTPGPGRFGPSEGVLLAVAGRHAADAPGVAPEPRVLRSGVTAPHLVSGCEHPASQPERPAPAARVVARITACLPACAPLAASCWVPAAPVEVIAQGCGGITPHPRPGCAPVRTLTANVCSAPFRRTPERASITCSESGCMCIRRVDLLDRTHRFSPRTAQPGCPCIPSGSPCGRPAAPPALAGPHGCDSVAPCITPTAPKGGGQVHLLAPLHITGSRSALSAMYRPGANGALN
jgi:hypothetical protein